MTESTQLTLLAMPKPFHGHIGIIQRNAVASWTKLSPRPDIYLFGKEEGIAETAAEFNVKHLPEVPRNEFGTPLLDGLLQHAREFVRTPLLCYVNSDIILLQEFLDSLSIIQKQFTGFLAVAHRLNIDLTEKLNFCEDGESKLRREILPHGTPGDHTAIDVFVFPVEMYQAVPPLALGRAWFDQWLIKEARTQGIPVVDVTRVARAIHQNHSYAHIAGGQQGAYWGEEARRSLTIYGGVPHAYTLLDATHEMLANGKIRRARYRRQRFLTEQWLWRTFVQGTASVRRRLGLQRTPRKQQGD